MSQPSAEPPASEVQLIVKNPSRAAAGDFTVTVPLAASLKDLKEKLQQEYEGQPEPAQQTLIYAGKVLKSDDARVGDILNPDIEAGTPHTLHLVVKGGVEQQHRPAPLPCTAPSPSATVQPAAPTPPEQPASRVAGPGTHPGAGSSRASSPEQSPEEDQAAAAVPSYAPYAYYPPAPALAQVGGQVVAGNPYAGVNPAMAAAYSAALAALTGSAPPAGQPPSSQPAAAGSAAPSTSAAPAAASAAPAGSAAPPAYAYALPWGLAMPQLQGYPHHDGQGRQYQQMPMPYNPYAQLPPLVPVVVPPMSYGFYPYPPPPVQYGAPYAYPFPLADAGHLPQAMQHANGGQRGAQGLRQRHPAVGAFGGPADAAAQARMGRRPAVRVRMIRINVRVLLQLALLLLILYQTRWVRNAASGSQQPCLRPWFTRF